MNKYKKPIITLLFWSILTTLIAQTSKIDSLENVLATGKLKNEEKAELFISLTSAYMNEDSAKFMEYATEALKLAQKYGLKSTEADAYINLGSFYGRRLLPYQAHAYYIKAEKIYLELDRKDRLFGIYTNLMYTFMRIEENDNAVYYADKAQKVAPNPRVELRTMLNKEMILGDARFPDYNGEEALEYFLNLYNLAIHIEDSLGINRDFSYYIGGRCETIYLNMNRPREALTSLFQSLAFAINIDNRNMVGLAYKKIADAYILMNKIDSAEYYIDKAMNSHIATNHYINAAYQTRAKIDSLKGNYLSALANYQNFHLITDSLSKEKKTTEMARLKLWHEFDQKEIEKKIIQQEYLKQRRLTYILGISSVVIFTLLAFTVLFYRKINKKNYELNEKNHQITEKNCELEELHATKDKIFSVVAHDLRTPISSLVSILELTQEDILDAESQKHVFKNISKRVDDAYRLLDNLLQWAKSQMQGIKSSPTIFDVQAESNIVVDLLQNTATSKRITINNRIEKRNVYADKDMFLVVLRNLTTNAIKYTSAGGEITIDSELSDKMLVLSVKDTGTGMSQEIQNKLFKLSETKSQLGTNNETGTGLGLVLCADFVKANGGKIWLTSKEGEGTTFFFSVPIQPTT